jgi:hypothetical protein
VCDVLRLRRFLAGAFILATALRALFLAAIAFLAAPFLAPPSAGLRGAGSAAVIWLPSRPSDRKPETA